MIISYVERDKDRPTEEERMLMVGLVEVRKYKLVDLEGKSALVEDALE